MEDRRYQQDTLRTQGHSQIIAQLVTVSLNSPHVWWSAENRVVKSSGTFYYIPGDLASNPDLFPWLVQNPSKSLFSSGPQFPHLFKKHLHLAYFSYFFQYWIFHFIFWEYLAQYNSAPIWWFFALISYASTVMLKILQATLQQYTNHELLDVHAWFGKGRATRYQIANICWIIKKARVFQKNIYFYFTDYAKVFDCADHNKLWKMLKEMGIPDHLTCLLRNLYAGQEATVRTGHGTTDWFQIGKGVGQGYILSPCLFNFYAEYISEMLDWMKHKLE